MNKVDIISGALIGNLIGVSIAMAIMGKWDAVWMVLLSATIVFILYCMYLNIEW